MKTIKKRSVFIACLALSIASFAATSSFAASVNASTGSNALATGDTLVDNTGGGGTITISLSPGVVMGFGAGSASAFVISAYNSKTTTASANATGVEYGAESTYAGYYMNPTTSTSWTFAIPTVATVQGWTKAGGS